MSIGQVLSLVITFFSITLVAVRLGVSDFGLFSSINALIVIVSKVTDLGFAPIVLREGAKDINDYRLLDTSITLRLIFIVIGFIGFNVFSIIFSVESITILLSNIMFMNLIVSLKYQNIRELLDTIFKIDLKMYYSTAVSLLDNSLFLVAVLFMPLFSGGIVYITLAYVLSNVPGFIIVLLILKRGYRFGYKVSFYKFKWLLREALPMWGFVLLTAVFQQIDLIFLKYFDSNYASGIYSAAMRLSITLIIIPNVISTTVFPMIMKNKSEDPSKNVRLIRLIYKILFFAAFCIAVTCTFEAEKIVAILFGKSFSPAAVPMIFLLWSQVFLFYNYFSVDIFTAHNSQKYNFLYSSIVMGINIALMMLLIPYYSYNGIAVAKIVSSMIGSGLIVIWMKQIGIKISYININIVAFCLVIGILLFILSFLPLYVYVVASIVMLAIVTKRIGFFSQEEILTILQLFKLERFSRFVLATGK